MADRTSARERPARRARPAAPKAASPARASAAVVNPLLTMQQTQGNQAVQRMLGAGPLPPGLLAGQQTTLGNRAVQRLATGSAAPAIQRFTDEDVKTRAYYLWESKGKRDQDQVAQEADYFQARNELQAEADALVVALGALSAQSKRHITVPKHKWDLAVEDPATYQHSDEKNTSHPDPASWAQVEKVMAQVLREGKKAPYKTSAQQNQMTIKGQSVVVTYIKLPSGYRVSDGWVVS